MRVVGKYRAVNKERGGMPCVLRLQEEILI